MQTTRFTWGRCGCCGGDLPLADMKNNSPAHPVRLRYGGDCPGHISADGVCGAYEGWSRSRIRQYMQRRGVR